MEINNFYKRKYAIQEMLLINLGKTEEIHDLEEAEEIIMTYMLLLLGA